MGCEEKRGMEGFSLSNLGGWSWHLMRWGSLGGAGFKREIKSSVWVDYKLEMALRYSGGAKKTDGYKSGGSGQGWPKAPMHTCLHTSSEEWRRHPALTGPSAQTQGCQEGPAPAPHSRSGRGFETVRIPARPSSWSSSLIEADLGDGGSGGGRG